MCDLERERCREADSSALHKRDITQQCDYSLHLGLEAMAMGSLVLAGLALILSAVVLNVCVIAACVEKGHTRKYAHMLSSQLYEENRGNQRISMSNLGLEFL